MNETSVCAGAMQLATNDKESAQGTIFSYEVLIKEHLCIGYEGHECDIDLSECSPQRLRCNDCRRKNKNFKRRQAYANNWEGRELKKAKSRQYYWADEKRRENMKARMRKYQVERYANDSFYREKKKARSIARYHQKKFKTKIQS